MEENKINMPVEEKKRQGIGIFPQASHTQRPPSGEASAGDESLQALWLIFVKIQPSLSSLLQDLTEWHASKIQGPSSHIPQEIKLGPGEPNSDIPKETPSDGEKPILDVPQVIGSNAEEASLGIHQQTGLDAGEPSCKESQEAGSNAGEQSVDVHKEIGSDAKQPNSTVPQETCLNTENLSRYIPQEIGLEEEKPSLGQASLGPNMHQEIGVGGMTSQQVSLQIDDEKRSSTESYKRKEETPFDERVCLLKAALIGDWPTAKSILQKYPNAIRTPTTELGEIALQIAVAGNHKTFAKEVMKLTKPEHLMLKDKYVQTALFHAARSGNVNCAKEMVKMNNKLPFIHDEDDDLPIHIAAQMGQRNMVLYLFSMTPFEQVPLLKCMNLLTYTIVTDMYYIGLEILSKDSTLATAKDCWGNMPLEHLAEKPLAIGHTRELSCCKRHLNFGCRGLSKAYIERKACELIRFLWTSIRRLPEEDFLSFLDQQLHTVHAVAGLGNVALLDIITSDFPDLILKKNGDGNNLIHIAILHRQKDVFSLLCKRVPLGKLASAVNAEGNNVPHLAGILAPPARLNMLSGEALQMREELLWFKGIEKIVPHSLTRMRNEDGKMPHEVFTEQHEILRKAGEQWMKNTANNCMLVAALIATIVFAAAFTLPGGNDQNDGTPIFLGKEWFSVFFLSDAISLLSSSTSILIFLSVLTSSYKDDIFLKSLPRKMLFGLITLFISIVGMVLAFSALCALIFEGKTIQIPTFVIAYSVPVILFVWLQWEFWAILGYAAFGSKDLFGQHKCRSFHLNLFRVVITVIFLVFFGFLLASLGSTGRKS